MNIIKLNLKQVNDILSWRDKNKDLVRHYLPYLTEGSIQIDDNNRIDFTVAFEEPIQFTTIYYNNNIIVFSLTWSADGGNGFWLLEKENYVNYSLLQGQNEYSYEELRQNILTVYASVNAYFFHYRQDLSIVEQKEVKRHTVKGKNNTYKYKIEKSLNRIHTIVGKIHHNKIPENRQWRVDCWGVVGHIRHYKNGKEVYIKPYLKGKNRLNGDNNKIYKI